MGRGEYTGSWDLFCEISDIISRLRKGKILRSNLVAGRYQSFSLEKIPFCGSSCWSFSRGLRPFALEKLRFFTCPQVLVLSRCLSQGCLMLWSVEATVGVEAVCPGPQRLLQPRSSLIIPALPWTTLEWSWICLRTRPGGVPTRAADNPVMSEARASLFWALWKWWHKWVFLYSCPSLKSLAFVLLREQTWPKSCSWHLLPALDPVPLPGGPSLPGPDHLGDSAVQMENGTQRWASGDAG